MERSTIDVASGRAVMDETLVVARHLISNMPSSTQQFGIEASLSRMVNEIGAIDNLRLENQLIELTSLVRQLAVGQHQPSIAARVCGICTFVEHSIDMCPTLQETVSNHPKSVGAIGGYQYGKQPYQSRQFDNQQFGRFESRAICGSTIRIYPEYTSRSSWLSTAEFSILGTTIPIIITTKSSISRQLTIFGRPDEAVSNKQSGSAGSSNLPSQTISNPSGNTSMVSLRSGRELTQTAPQQRLRPADADS
ncbi:hypothetical protein CR513_09764, partial [Mucuna pruriens]